MEALRKSGFVFLPTLVTAILFMCLAALPLQIAMIAIGAKYTDECPVESMIPIYLMVAGAAGLFANCCSCRIRYQEGDQGEEKSVNPLQAVQHFLLAWFICGNMRIYEKLKAELLRSRL